MKFYSIVFFGLLLTACSSNLTKIDQNLNYNQTISRYTKSDKQYSGLDNTYQVSVTYLGREMTDLKNRKLALVQQWTAQQIEKARYKANKNLGKTTNFTVLLYTPNGRQNDLKKGETSIWRTYLEVGGKKYLGTAEPSGLTVSQLKTLYPEMTNFSRAYRVYFPIPDDEVSSESITFVMASELGTSKFTY